MRDVKKLSWAEFIKQYDESVRDAIANARRNPKATGIATLQCEVMDSSLFGNLSALIYGPQCTYQGVEDMLIKNPGGIYTTGLPSSAAFPINYTEDMPS
jgi:hypothetical protein